MMKKLLVASVAILSSIAHAALEEKRMELIIPSYNNAKWYDKNWKSIFSQRYANYHVTYIDDCSHDGTADLVVGYVKAIGQEKRFTLIRNKERRGALENLYHAIHACSDNTVVVTVDGDDWLYDDQVLVKLNEAYSTHNIWLTHGRFVETASGWDGWCIPIPDEVIQKNEFRSFRCPSHLRTFYAWLFKKIPQADLMYEGKFFSMTWDQAMLFPMFEMAGERQMFMPDILYVYNTTTTLSDNKVNPRLQKKLEFVIRSMPKYNRLPDSYNR